MARQVQLNGTYNINVGVCTSRLGRLWLDCGSIHTWEQNGSDTEAGVINNWEDLFHANIWTYAGRSSYRNWEEEESHKLGLLMSHIPQLPLKLLHELRQPFQLWHIEKLLLPICPRLFHGMAPSKRGLVFAPKLVFVAFLDSLWFCFKS